MSALEAVVQLYGLYCPFQGTFLEPTAALTVGEDFFDSVMRCGLYLGAVFQLICLAAVVIAPDRTGDPPAHGKDFDGSDDEASDHSTPQATPRRPAHGHHRPRKQEKKKRR